MSPRHSRFSDALWERKRMREKERIGERRRRKNLVPVLLVMAIAVIGFSTAGVITEAYHYGATAGGTSGLKVAITMPPQKVSRAYAVAETYTVQTSGFTANAGNMVVVEAAFYGDSSPSVSITDTSSNTYAVIGTHWYSTGNVYVWIGYATAGTTNTNLKLTAWDSTGSATETDVVVGVFSGLMPPNINVGTWTTFDAAGGLSHSQVWSDPGYSLFLFASGDIGVGTTGASGYTGLAFEQGTHAYTYTLYNLGNATYGYNFANFTTQNAEPTVVVMVSVESLVLMAPVIQHAPWNNPLIQTNTLKGCFGGNTVGPQNQYNGNGTWSGGVAAWSQWPWENACTTSNATSNTTLSGGFHGNGFYPFEGSSQNPWKNYTIKDNWTVSAYALVDAPGWEFGNSSVSVWAFADLYDQTNSTNWYNGNPVLVGQWWTGGVTTGNHCVKWVYIDVTDEDTICGNFGGKVTYLFKNIPLYYGHLYIPEEGFLIETQGTAHPNPPYDLPGEGYAGFWYSETGPCGPRAFNNCSLNDTGAGPFGLTMTAFDLYWTGS